MNRLPLPSRVPAIPECSIGKTSKKETLSTAVLSDEDGEPVFPSRVARSNDELALKAPAKRFQVSKHELPQVLPRLRQHLQSSLIYCGDHKVTRIRMAPEVTILRIDHQDAFHNRHDRFQATHSVASLAAQGRLPLWARSRR